MFYHYGLHFQQPDRIVGDSPFFRLQLSTHPYFHRRQKKSLSTIIKENLTTRREPIPSLMRQSKSLDPEENAAKLATKKLDDGNMKGAIRILCCDDKIAPFDDHTFLKLVEKHPKAASTPDVQNVPQATVNHHQTSSSEVLKTISSFPPGLAAGLDGLRPQILKDLTSPQVGIHGENLFKSITQLCNLMLEGLVPPSILPILYGGSLCAFTKKDGGIRPIAVGNTFRRITAKICSRQLYKSVVPALQPFQLGFGTKCGSEAAVHSTRTYLQGTELLRKAKNYFKAGFQECF